MSIITCMLLQIVLFTYLYVPRFRGFKRPSLSNRLRKYIQPIEDSKTPCGEKVFLYTTWGVQENLYSAGGAKVISLQRYPLVK